MVDGATVVEVTVAGATVVGATALVGTGTKVGGTVVAGAARGLGVVATGRVPVPRLTVLVVDDGVAIVGAAERPRDTLVEVEVSPDGWGRGSTGAGRSPLGEDVVVDDSARPTEVVGCVGVDGAGSSTGDDPLEPVGVVVEVDVDDDRAAGSSWFGSPRRPTNAINAIAVSPNSAAASGTARRRSSNPADPKRSIVDRSTGAALRADGATGRRVVGATTTGGGFGSTGLLREGGVVAGAGVSAFGSILGDGFARVVDARSIGASSVDTSSDRAACSTLSPTVESGAIGSTSSRQRAENSDREPGVKPGFDNGTTRGGSSKNPYSGSCEAVTPIDGAQARAVDACGSRLLKR